MTETLVVPPKVRLPVTATRSFTPLPAAVLVVLERSKLSVPPPVVRLARVRVPMLPALAVAPGADYRAGAEGHGAAGDRAQATDGAAADVHAGRGDEGGAAADGQQPGLEVTTPPTVPEPSQ